MPVTFKKIEAATETTPQIVTSVQKAHEQMGELADPLHEMLMEMKHLRSQMTAIEKKMKPLKAEFLTAYNEAYDDLDASHTIDGKEHQLKVAAVSKKRQVDDMDTCFDMLEAVQEDLFKQLCKVNLSDLDKYLTPDQVEQIVEVIRDPASRAITPVVE